MALWKTEPNIYYALLTLVMAPSAFTLSIPHHFIHLVIFCSKYFYFLQQTEMIEMGHLGAGIASVWVFAVPLMPGTGTGLHLALDIYFKN